VPFDNPGQDHCRIGREIAVGRIARRLDRDPAEIEPRRQQPLPRQIAERRQDKAAEVTEDICHVEA
jgi:hypothetical protein